MYIEKKKADISAGLFARISSIDRLVLPDGLIRCASPLDASLGAGGAIDDVPLAVGRSPDSRIGLAVAVIITGDRDVAAGAPGDAPLRAGGTVDDVPLAF